ncbi:MAG: hypothetical protein M3317_03095 [Actinomycetota bacterium]|nr:hypothetical protein [Actinomycetota bacterium]
MSKVKRLLAAASVSALMLAVMAAPAFAFHHGFVPGAPCGIPEFSGGDASAVDEHNPVFVRPLPPAGTAAVEHSDLIGPGTQCPAPNK